MGGFGWQVQLRGPYLCGTTRTGRLAEFLEGRERCDTDSGTGYFKAAEFKRLPVRGYSRGSMYRVRMYSYYGASSLVLQAAH